MSFVIWAAVLLLVAILSFVAGVRFGRDFWFDVKSMQMRR